MQTGKQAGNVLKMRRSRGVVAELHGELALALGGGAELGAEAEHGVQTAVADKGEVLGADLGVVDGGVALVHEHDDVALELVGRGDGGLHEGLEDLAAGLVEGLAEGHLGREVEGEVGRVGDVGGAVVDDHLGADDLVAQERALVGGLLEALAAGSDVLVGDGAADDLVLEQVLLRVLKGLDPAGDAGVVAGAAGLAAEEEVVLGLAGDGLAVGDAGLARLAVDLVLAAQALDVDLKVQLAHARDDGLLGLVVDVQAEGRVLALEARHDGVRDEHGGHGVGQVAVGEGVAGGAVDAEDGADLAGADLVDVLHLVGVHADDAGDADLLVGAGVEEVGALAELALVDADVGELAVVVLLELEGEADEGQRVVGHELDDGLVALLVEGLVLDLGRVGEVVADGVEHGLDTLVGEGGAHHDWGELEGDGGAADGGLDLEVGRDLLVEEELGHLVVDVGELLDELLALLLDKFVVVSGEDVGRADDGAAGALEVVSLLLDQVDDALELVLGADGDLDGGGGDLELAVDLLDGLPGVGAHAVHLVHEADAGDVVALHLAVDGDGLALDARDGAQDHDGAVEHAQSTLDLDGEVDVARGVDDVDVVGFLFSVFRLLPVGEGGGRLDGDALLSLEVHRVHLGADRVLAADLVDGADAARVEQNALRGRRLAAVDVGGDADVAHARETLRLDGAHLGGDELGGEGGGVVLGQLQGLGGGLGGPDRGGRREGASGGLAHVPCDGGSRRRRHPRGCLDAGGEAKGSRISALGLCACEKPAIRHSDGPGSPHRDQCFADG
ncbi:hypothetical protein CTA2_4081 [Colletotrichum tanaceti]|uniref:NAD-specific glutamate dehydrogenase n=1 Tax=Colletotrichum tanaceti TaxID=1306861 RepID=A0A4V6DI47_9PEZI|nr:hypothetical protein CTA2_4081 [Colletotrichum tanaceti]TKW57836.1 hypothetical protein CTA1_9797 [Colletotrichum tanaceti]